MGQQPLDGVEGVAALVNVGRSTLVRNVRPGVDILPPWRMISRWRSQTDRQLVVPKFTATPHTEYCFFKSHRPGSRTRAVAAAHILMNQDEALGCVVPHIDEPALRKVVRIGVVVGTVLPNITRS